MRLQHCVCNFTSVVADEMGLGKTLTMISLVLKDLPGERKWRGGGPSSQDEAQLGSCGGALDALIAIACLVCARSHCCMLKNIAS